MNNQGKSGALLVAILLTVGACQPASDGSDSATNTRPPEATESLSEMDAIGDTPIDTVNTDRHRIGRFGTQLIKQAKPIVKKFCQRTVGKTSLFNITAQ